MKCSNLIVNKIHLFVQAIQDRVRDLPEGGRPFFVHEVIDMGGEAIKSNEYFGVGKVTEFRYGRKLADCIRGGDFNCLGGIYDQVGRDILTRMK